MRRGGVEFLAEFHWLSVDHSVIKYAARTSNVSSPANGELFFCSLSSVVDLNSTVEK